MEKYIIILLIIIVGMMSINGIEKINNNGYYLNVKHQVYSLYRLLETITNGYVQVDCD